MKRHTKWQSWYSASSLAGGSLKLVLPWFAAWTICKNFGERNFDVLILNSQHRNVMKTMCKLLRIIMSDYWCNWSYSGDFYLGITLQGPERLWGKRQVGDQTDGWNWERAMGGSLQA
jgi:hypothetical protein